jgi:hypothetical protein
MVVSSAGLGPESDCSGKARSNCTSKLQTHPLVREGVQHQETRSFQTEKKFGHEFQIGARHEDTLAD